MYEEDGATNKFFVSSGSVSINEDASVQILAEEVHKIADIDAAAAKDLVAKASAKVAAAVDEVCYMYWQFLDVTIIPFYYYYCRLQRQKHRLSWRLERPLLLPVHNQLNI